MCGFDVVAETVTRFCKQIPEDPCGAGCPDRSSEGSVPDEVGRVDDATRRLIDGYTGGYLNLDAFD